MAKNVVIIGNSAAGIGAAEAIRELDREARIAILTEEPFSAYEKPKMFSVLDGRLKERELVWRAPEFYQKNNIELFLEAKVMSVSLHRKKVALKQGEPLAFDQLMVASGRKEAVPSLKGALKEGVVFLNALSDVKFILENLPIAHTVAVIGEGDAAEAVARIIAGKKIDVKFFGPFAGPPDGLDVVAENPVIEILGEADVRAVRLANHKVIGANLVIFSGHPQPNASFLDETDIRRQDGGLIVDEAMRTNVDFVWAAGDVCAPGGSRGTGGWDVSYQAGRRAGESLCRST